MTKPDRVRVVCATCGSSEVRKDAYAEFDEDTQQWVLASVHDGNDVCDNCGGETRLKDVPLKRFVCYGYATITRPVTYVVDAPDAEAAIAQVENGQYVSEDYTGDGEVSDILVSEVRDHEAEPESAA